MTNVIDSNMGILHRLGALQTQAVPVLGLMADWITACGQRVHGYPTERGWSKYGTLTICRSCSQS